jgi:hypothetical protein
VDGVDLAKWNPQVPRQNLRKLWLFPMKFKAFATMMLIGKKNQKSGKPIP